MAVPGEAQKLSHSGTFGWKVHSGELFWSDETYRILGFTRETNPRLDLVFGRIHREDRERLSSSFFGYDPVAPPLWRALPFAHEDRANSKPSGNPR